MVAGSAALVACSSSSSGTDGATGGGGSTAASAKLSDIRSTIFTGSCALSASCHSGNNAAGLIDMSASRSNADLIAAFKKPSMTWPTQGAIAVPGQPDQSLLMRLLDEKACPIGGATCELMPQAGPALHAAQVQSIHDWIAGGMQDN